MNMLSKVLFMGGSYLLVWTGAAQAERGQISFQGEVQASTCEVRNDGGNPIVGLPVADAVSLNRAGSVTGLTRFVLEVDNCPPSVTEVSSYLEGPNINSEGRLDLTPGGAGNVQLQVLNNAQQVMNLAAASGSQGAPQRTVFNGAAELVFFVQYFATGAATPGPVTSSVQYSLIYL